ncbi:hypothetical protein [Kineosporia succinea]|uniref:CHASE1-domain containing sensor protein n=1 Tax=Kineosporia succinea TaxID=84632 RepID=A0ABT9P5V0_9ACTN|nr:hypothetical protein [Kineosporia succinea]MDP9828063.1 CHASE1-domain containing sensor protein [Kineosporia succinea]
MSERHEQPAALMLTLWRRCAAVALEAARVGDHDGAAGSLRMIRGLGHRAEQVSLLVWVDAVLEANGLAGHTGPACFRLYEIDGRGASQHPAIDWLGRLATARAEGDHDRMSRVMREAEVDQMRWREYLDQALHVAAHTIQLEPQRRAVVALN